MMSKPIPPSDPAYAIDLAVRLSRSARYAVRLYKKYGWNDSMTGAMGEVKAYMLLAKTIKGESAARFRVRTASK